MKYQLCRKAKFARSFSKSAATMVATYNLPLVSDFPGNREAIDQGFTTRYVYEHIYKTPKII